MSQLNEDLFDQIDQLERDNRRWRWLALTGLLGMFVLLPLTCASLGFWFLNYRDHYPNRYEEIRIRQDLDMERVNHEMQLQQLRGQLEGTRLEADEAKREVEELRKKVGKAPQ